MFHVGRRPAGKDNLAAVGMPIKIDDVKVAAAAQFLRFFALQIPQPQVGVLSIYILDLHIAIFFLPCFICFTFGARGHKSNRFTIGCGLERLDVTIKLG